MRRLGRLALAAAMLAGGCGTGATGPTPPAAPVRVTVSRLPTFVAGAALFAIRIDNISGSAVNLTFPSSCQVLPSFSDRAGRAVTPVGGGFACLTVITELSLLPGVSFMQPFTVKAGSTPEAQFVVLPPGEYTIRGRLEDTVYKLESAPLAFTLQ
ncbi:MAG TPA: hypothetical protein VFK57_04605 [Vicinamibacterales bacterium]|nr:hypothetical protein [Vicinamibacterales bacterium]